MNFLGIKNQAICHVVYFKFAADAESHLIKTTCEAFLNLQQTCLKDGKRYIKSINAGKDMSIEGKSKGLTHAFVVWFNSKEDRD